MESVDERLPVRYACPFMGAKDSRLFVTLGLQRSGQHAVIDWICRNLGDVVHFNHCRFFRTDRYVELTPVTGRRILYYNGKVQDSGVRTRDRLSEDLPKRQFKSLLYSLESVDIGSTALARLLGGGKRTLILILRDPYNWLASSMRHNRSSLTELTRSTEMLKSYLRQATGRQPYVANGVIAVDYNRFVADSDYRLSLCRTLHIIPRAEAEEALRNIPNFGGGSSFSGTAYEPNLAVSVCERWKHYINDRDYRRILRDEELRSLSEEFFGEFPSYRELVVRLWAD